MESSEEAVVGIFAIDPSSVVGRAIALRVLFCKSIAELRRILVLAISVYYEKFHRLGGKIYRRVVAPLFYWLHPRNPHAVLALIVGLALLLRRYTSVKSKAERAYRRKFWRNLMRNALTYDEWSHAARMLEKETPKRNECDLYDEELVKAKLHELQLRRHKGGLQDITFCLRADLVRNLGNMCNPDLHKGRLQVPRVIKEYIDEVSLQLRMVCDSDSEELPLEEKLSFMHETRHVFGRTALLLSGGASLGAFHVGVVKTLIDNHLLPRVVAGASVGSIICAVIATRTWPELQSVFADSFPNWKFFDQLGGIFATFKRLLTQGAVHEIRQLQRMLRSLTGNLTFQEAYDMTGRVLGISVCSPRRHEPPRCLNYLTSPHVVIWSAVTASCAFPGLFQAQELMAKDRHGELIPYHTPFQVGPEESGIGTRQWIDGSLESDLPMMQLKELFNVNHFIVSQANPHIAPLLRFKEIVRSYGGDFAAKLAHLVEMEVKHRCNQILELGFPLGGVAKLFAQDWEGDVTVVMPATLAQFAKIIQNPTYKELEKAINQGRRCTWEKLSAIKANCGIELVLDECVSLLNRMHRQKKNTGRAAPHGNSSVMISSGAKRIPSWNCMAHENSWGSLDEEGLLESVSHQGGPWGGPSGRVPRFARNTHDGSDSESDNMDHNVSWTRVGGPLMRTASATTFIQTFEVHGEFNKHGNREEAQGHDDSEGSVPHTSYPYHTSHRDMPYNNSDSHGKWNCDRNSDPTVCHLNSSDTINSSDADDQSCSFPDSRKRGCRLSRSPSTIAIAEIDLLLAERSPSGTVFNVVKREDISSVNGYHDVDTYSKEHTYIVDECIQLDSLVRDEDDNPTTSPECSAPSGDSDACILLPDECYGIEKKLPDENFLKVERTVDLNPLCRWHAPEMDKADLANADGVSNVKELVSYIDNELSEGHVRNLVAGNHMIGLQPSDNECRAPQLTEEPINSNDEITYGCCGRSSCLSEDSSHAFRGDNPDCIDKDVNSFEK